MKRIIFLIMVIFYCSVQAQDFVPAPTVTLYGGALSQDSLDNKVQKKDSSAVSGTAATYVTPTMLNLRMLKSDSSATSGTATKYTTPTMLGTKVAKADSSITTGVVGYVTPTMGATKVSKSDSSITTGVVGYVSPTMAATALAAKVAKADSSVTSGVVGYVTPTLANSTYLKLSLVYAAIDSFTTTGQTKDITVSGAVVGGAVIVTPMSPEYSATADTGQQYSGFVKAGGGTIEIVRTKYTAASTIKTGAHFSYIYIKPR
jgi:hypothetical protein